MDAQEYIRDLRKKLRAMKIEPTFIHKPIIPTPMISRKYTDDEIKAFMECHNDIEKMRVFFQDRRKRIMTIKPYTYRNYKNGKSTHTS